MSAIDLRAILDAAEPFTPAAADPDAATITAAIADIEAADRRLRAGGLQGFRTGYRRLDELTGGIPREGITVIGGWSSCGKTSLAVPIALAMIGDGARVIVFSADMTNAEMLRRFARARHELPGTAFRTEPMSDTDRDALRETAEYLTRRGFVLAPEKAWSATDCIRFAEERAGRFDAVLIDTMQSLVPEGNEPQYERFNASLAKFKGFKKDHRCAVVVTWQVKDPPNRFELARHTKDGKPVPPGPPTLNELEGTRRATQEAALVLLVWRADYGASFDEGEAPTDAKIIVAKSQAGVTGSLIVDWDRDRARFVDLIGNVMPGGCHA